MKIVMTAALLGALFAGATGAAQQSLAMGPDPGGHSGATVTPETTKTDNKGVDSARETRSPGKTESVQPAKDKDSAQPAQSDKPSSDAASQSGAASGAKR